MTGTVHALDGSEIQLVCWLDWYDGPVSGLAQWRGETCWFAMEGDAGVEPRTYFLFELTPEQLLDALKWFDEKRNWFEHRAPEIRKIVSEISDKAEQDQLIERQGLALRDWPGPDITTPPFGRFDDKRMHQRWYNRDRWCPPRDFSS